MFYCFGRVFKENRIKYLKSLNPDVVDNILMIRYFRDMEYYFVLLCDRNKLNGIA